MIDFEFDPDKSTANHTKHGIDFVVAQNLWLAKAAQKPLPHIAEERFMRIGLLDEKLWTAIFTLRGERVRLISVRRTRAKEVADYERAALRDQEGEENRVRDTEVGPQP